MAAARNINRISLQLTELVACADHSKSGYTCQVGHRTTEWNTVRYTPCTKAFEIMGEDGDFGPQLDAAATIAAIFALRD